MNVTQCRTCPFLGSQGRCNLRTWAHISDPDNQRSVHCPLNEGPVTVTGSDPEWLRALKARE